MHLFYDLVCAGGGYSVDIGPEFTSADRWPYPGRCIFVRLLVVRRPCTPDFKEKCQGMEYVAGTTRKNGRFWLGFSASEGRRQQEQGQQFRGTPINSRECCRLSLALQGMGETHSDEAPRRPCRGSMSRGSTDGTGFHSRRRVALVTLIFWCREVRPLNEAPQRLNLDIQPQLVYWAVALPIRHPLGAAFIEPVTTLPQCALLLKERCSEMHHQDQ